MPQQYYFGWKKQQPDQRDYQFSAPYSVVKALPPKFDLDTPSPGLPFDPAWDQGQLGACGPNALCEVLVYDGIKKGNPLVPSRLFVYWTTRLIMNTINYDSGVDNRSMMKALTTYGWPNAGQWPYHIDKFIVKPPQPAFNQAKPRAAGFVYQAVPQTLDQMKGCLVTTGLPFVFGFTVYESMMTQAVSASGDVPLPAQNEAVAGGHDVTIVGWDDATLRFKFKNHWTAQWGKAGYGTIPYSYALNPNLAGDFWTVSKTGA